MKRLLICTFVVAFTGSASAADICAADAPMIKKCVYQTLVDENVVLPGNIISDPGGTKTKQATELCQLDCNLKQADFKKKWGG